MDSAAVNANNHRHNEPDYSDNKELLASRNLANSIYEDYLRSGVGWFIIDSK